MTTHIAGPPTPNWAKWRLIPKVRVWQAAALSLNICPDWIHLLELGLDEQGVDRWIGSMQEWKDRSDIISANREEMEARPNDQYPEHDTISLQRFLVWATRVGLDIPEELKAISSVVPPALKRASKQASAEPDRPRRPTDQHVKHWHKARVQSWPKDAAPPTEIEDLKAARLELGGGVVRQQIRSARKSAPDYWRKQGPR